MNGEGFAYFRWHCLRYTQPGDSCHGFTAWKCHRRWKSGNR